jgi:glutamate dehydrogenase (NAD(P)+)
VEFNITDASLIDEIGPEKIIAMNNPSIGLKSILVIDNSTYGIPAGGVRLAPDISVDEMIRLGRAMSLKFCTYRLKIGGAKAGIWGDPLDEEQKNLLLTGFANQIEPYIKNDLYYPGPDMGTDDDDLLKIFKVIGAPNLAPNKIGMFKSGVPVEELFTGYGVVYCLNMISKNISNITGKHINIKKPRVLLEGFGKVGTALAMSLQEYGFQLNGISTINGAIFDEDGLDIEQLLKLKLKHRDELIYHYESKNLIKVSKEKFFELSTEVPIEYLIPGARPDVINKTNVDNINGIAIVPAANIPYERGIPSILSERKILAFPDFVSNAGEVLAILVNKVAKNADEIFDYIKTKLSEKTLEVIKGAKENNISVYDYAVDDALTELKKKIKRKKNYLEKQNKRY